VGYSLGIDLGTTYSAAAIVDGGRAEVFTLGTVAPAIPSVVVLREDGEVLVGEAAERRSIVEPTRTGREFKRRLGDPAPLVLGGTPYGAEALMARLLRFIVDEVTKRQGTSPERIVITHPANFGPYKKDLMLEMARLADVGEVQFLTEPEAAAINYSRQNRLEAGEVVAVYDFGGGTFDAAVLRRVGDGFEVLGQPEGMERLGGIDFDQAIMAHVDDAVGGQVTEADASDAMTRGSLARLRADVRSAKESLSSDTDVTIPVMLPALQTEVRLTRPEFEAMIRPRLLETVSALERAVRSAGIQMSDVSKILLVGGSSRIPLVAEIIQQATNRPVAVDAHPKFAIALGAARAGAADMQRAAETAPVETAPAAAAPPIPAAETAPMPAVDAPVAPPSPRPEAAPPPRRRGVPLIAIGLAALLLIGVAAAAFVLLGNQPGSGTAGGPSSGASTAPGTTAGAESSAPAGTEASPGTSAPGTTGEGGLIVTFAGSATQGDTGDGGAATAAQLSQVGDLAVGSDGTVYIADIGNYNVRAVAPDGTIETLATELWNPHGIDVDTDGNVYVADTFFDRILRITPDGQETTIAGAKDVQAYGGDGGPATEALLGSPYDVAVGSDGSLYIADTQNHRVRKIDPSGIITTIAGTGSPGFLGDGGPATEALLARPWSIAVDADDNVYVVDYDNSRIRRIDSSGTITTFAGNDDGTFEPMASGSQASDVSFEEISEVTVDRDGNVYANPVRVMVRITPDGTLTVVAGGGIESNDGVPASEAVIQAYQAIAIDPTDGTLYLGDFSRVRLVEGVGPGS